MFMSKVKKMDGYQKNTSQKLNIETEKNIFVPYIVHESDMTRLERTNKRLFAGLIVAIIILFASNLTWLYVWNQYDYASDTTTYTQDGKGTNIIGDANYVTDINSEEDQKNQEKWKL